MSSSNNRLVQRDVFVAGLEDWARSVPKLLDAAGLASAVPPGAKVLLKPNLVNADKPPVTTPVGLVREIVRHLKSRVPDVDIVVGEGCGDIDFDTWTPFRDLGYREMADAEGVLLVDLNTAPLVELSDPENSRWPVFRMPRIVMESFLVSVPVLKAHSMSGVTLSLKNMLGVAPPSFYCAGSWKKSAFHRDLHEAIFGLNLYRKPDFVVLDASVGMCEAHLWGARCSPPVNKLAASFDPVAIDAFGCGLLGRDWRKIPHVKMAHGRLGLAEPLKTTSLP